MKVDEMHAFLMNEWPRIREELLSGRYKPSPVRKVDIPKDGGGTRQLGIPTVIDRFIQQALLQVLQPLFDPTFSASSFGYRPGRSAHQAVLAAQAHVRAGRRIAVDVDLEKFFDRVNHDVLMGRLANRIDDKRVLLLIRRFLNAGMMSDGVVVERKEGTPQGGPLSPLLANFLLDEVDKELEKRGHKFVRYADDLTVYVKSQAAGERVLEGLRRLYSGLRLRINESKTAVAPVSTRKLLGFAIVVSEQGQVRIRIADKAIAKMKAKVRLLTKRTRAVGMKRVVDDLSVYLRGWHNYFRLAKERKLFRRLDEWIRCRLRALQVRLWKTGPTTYRSARKLGATGLAAGLLARNAHRPTRAAITCALSVITNAFFEKLGLAKLLALPQLPEPLDA
jgi:RNA-directed DNA polymerase